MRTAIVAALGAAGVALAMAGSSLHGPRPTLGPGVEAEVGVTANDARLARAQNSPMLAFDPSNTEFVALATRLDAPDFNCALHTSPDAGRRWAAANPVPRLPPGVDKCYAPEVGFDGTGRLYYLFLGLAGGGNRPVGAFLTSSADGGNTFDEPRRVLGPANYQVRMVVDPSPAPAGRIHLDWLNTTAEPLLGGLPASPNPIVASHSDDGGITFSSPVYGERPGASTGRGTGGVNRF